MWFSIVVIAQTLALAGAAIQLFAAHLGINLASVFAAGAAGGLAWLQIKRHQELTQSYAVAAYELGLIVPPSSGSANDEGLSNFVNDAETAISREHTMWIARREGRA